MFAATPGSAGATKLQRDVLAEQRVLDGAWRPPALRRPVTPVAGRVLHMLQRSLPHHRSGSTYRTHYTTQAQLAAGLDPAVLTEPGFPTATPDVEPEIVDGVPHHRLARAVRADGAVATLDERLGDYLRAASPVVERVRPAVLHPASDYRNALVAIELGRRHALPVVYEVRGFPEIFEGRWAGSRTTFEKAQWRRDVEAECWRQADRVVTLAEVMKAPHRRPRRRARARGGRAQRGRRDRVPAGAARSGAAPAARHRSAGPRGRLRVDARGLRGGALPRRGGRAADGTRACGPGA